MSNKFDKMQHILKETDDLFYFVHVIDLHYITGEENKTALILLCSAVFSETLIKTQGGESHRGALAPL